MFAKLIVPGGCPPPKPGDCGSGQTPKGDCIMLGGIPWGNCLKGAG